jgi:hypothetical protein
LVVFFWVFRFTRSNKTLFLFGISKTCPSHFQVPSYAGVFNDLRMTRSWNNLHKVLSSWKTGKLNNYKVFESEQLKLLNFRGLFGVDQHIINLRRVWWSSFGFSNLLDQTKPYSSRPKTQHLCSRKFRWFYQYTNVLILM